MNQIDLALETLRTTWYQVVQFLPRLLGVIVVLTLGWLIARALRTVLIRVLRLLRLDLAAEKAGIEDFLLRGGIRYTTVTLIGQVVYWGVLLVVVLMIFNLLGLPGSTALIERVVAYLPNVVIALAILVFGGLLARFIRGVTGTYLNNIGVSSGDGIALLAEGAVLVFVGMLALEQLKIGGQILVSAFQLAFGGLCLAMALAFGFGGRKWAQDILEKTRKK